MKISKTKLEALRAEVKGILDELDTILAIDDAQEAVPVNENLILISCDGSIVKNPGGPSAIGFTVQQPKLNLQQQGMQTKAKTNNEAELDAIYSGLNFLMGVNPSPLHPIEVESDSQFVVDLINGKKNTKIDRLVKKRDYIIELKNKFSQKVTFVWRRRNSTKGLALANRLAQVTNGVKPH